MLDTNKIYLMDCVEGCKNLDDASIDLVVTSPPYDNMRAYDSSQGFAWNDTVWKQLADQLFRVVKPGGVVVWVVADATIDGNETGTSFKQALYFKECGFNLHDTMIWLKNGGGAIGSNYAYTQNFEYMFVFSKGKPKSINLIEDMPTGLLENAGKPIMRKDSMRGVKKLPGVPRSNKVYCASKEFARRNNWWYLPPHPQDGSKFHPAVYPPEIARDHIISWSSVDDIVLDPFMGSGTTAVEAVKLKRKFIGFDVSPDYVTGANKRLKDLTGPFKLFGDIGC